MPNYTRSRMAPVTLMMYFIYVGFFTTVRSQLQCPSECTCSLAVSGDGIIDCSNRGLTEVIAVYHPLAPRMEKIDFSHNMLTTLDIETLFQLIAGLQVDVLDFSFNSINAVTGTFNATLGKDYETLNLSNNALTSFPKNVIPKKHLRSRLILDFSSNQLTELTAQMFAGGDDFFPGFQFLARNNLISRVDNEAFQGVSLVDAVIDLRNNQLTTLSSGFKNPAGLQNISLSGNPWNCDCNLRWIVDPNRFLINFTASDPPSCQAPVLLRGRPVFGLTANEFICYQGSSTNAASTEQPTNSLTGNQSPTLVDGPTSFLVSVTNGQISVRPTSTPLGNDSYLSEVNDQISVSPTSTQGTSLSVCSNGSNIVITFITVAFHFLI